MAAHDGQGTAEGGTDFYTCSCSLTKNFFCPALGHVDFCGQKVFLLKYKQILEDKHFEEDDIQRILSQLELERERRLNLQATSAHRQRNIKSVYKHLHPQLLNLQDNMLDPAFLRIAAFARSPGASNRVLHDVVTSAPDTGKQIYTLPVFTEEFCVKLMEELDQFETTDLPKGRPNSMNNYGVLLDELGFDPGLLTPLRERFLNPICRLLFPDWGGGVLDSHKAFVVKYKIGEDAHLDYHYDNAEVTLNVCLGKDFDEGSLYFGDMKGQPQHEPNMTEHAHRVAHGLLHRGRHMHGAMPIQHGTRYNLIMWMRSSKIRNRRCPMCEDIPGLMPVTSGFGDGFTKESVNVCRLL